MPSFKLQVVARFQTDPIPDAQCGVKVVGWLISFAALGMTALPDWNGACLGLGLRGLDFCAGLSEIEAQRPFRRYALARDFCWSEIPLFGGFRGRVAKKFAGTGRRLGSGYRACRVHVNSYEDAHRTMDGAPCLVRNCRQDLIQDFARGHRTGSRNGPATTRNCRVGPGVIRR